MNDYSLTSLTVPPYSIPFANTHTHTHKKTKHSTSPSIKPPAQWARTNHHCLSEWVRSPELSLFFFLRRYLVLFEGLRSKSFLPSTQNARTRTSTSALRDVHCANKSISQLINSYFDSLGRDETRQRLSEVLVMMMMMMMMDLTYNYSHFHPTHTSQVISYSISSCWNWWRLDWLTIWETANGLLIPPFVTWLATVRSSYNTWLWGAAADSNTSISHLTFPVQLDSPYKKQSPRWYHGHGYGRYSSSSRSVSFIPGA